MRNDRSERQRAGIDQIDRLTKLGIETKRPDGPDAPVDFISAKCGNKCGNEPATRAFYQLNQLPKNKNGGWGGIRTHGTLSRTPVFKTGAFNRSATHPARLRYKDPYLAICNEMQEEVLSFCE